MILPATILLIEDDREIQNTIRSVLESVGYNVIIAPNGIEGKRIIQSRQLDLIITDMMMPQLGGFPVLEFLKQEVTNPPPVIMITANEGGRHKAYAEMLGVDNYLRKPFAMDVMLEAVEKSIARGRAAREEGTPAEDAPAASETAPAPEGSSKLRRAPRKKAAPADDE